VPQVARSPGSNTSTGTRRTTWPGRTQSGDARQPSRSIWPVARRSSPSRGIGAAIALRLAEVGAAVVVHYRGMRRAHKRHARRSRDRADVLTSPMLTSANPRRSPRSSTPRRRSTCPDSTWLKRPSKRSSRSSTRLHLAYIGALPFETANTSRIDPAGGRPKHPHAPGNPRNAIAESLAHAGTRRLSPLSPEAP
jgi:hypothetical protein